jgi:tetratricopeptide (TPR) repeat protein
VPVVSDVPAGDRASQKRTVLLAFAAAIAAFLVYAPSIRNGFIWDDPIMLGQQLPAFRSVADVFFPPAGIPQFGIYYYRPVVTLSYLFDLRLGGGSPVPFHLTVVLLHAACCSIVFLLGRSLLGPARAGVAAPFAAALLFAVHPIHTESVSWIAGRSDVLATAFALLGVLAYVAWRRRPGRPAMLALGCVLELLACLSKEVGLAGIAIAFAADVCGLTAPATPATDEAPRRRAGWWLRGWLPLAVAAAVYVAMRHRALAADDATLDPQDASASGGLAALVRATGFYVSKSLVPVRLGAFIPEMPDPGRNLAVGAFGLVAAAALVAIALRRRDGLAAFLVAGFAASLAPSLAIAWFRISETPVAERYLYLPSAFLCLAAGHALFAPARVPRTFAGAATTALVAAGAVGTLLREPVWRDDVVFWEDAAAKSPGEGLPHLHLGVAYQAAGRTADAESEYRAALAARYDDEGRATVLNDLGMLHLEREPDVAASWFDEAIRIRPAYATPWYGRGVATILRAKSEKVAGRFDVAHELTADAERDLLRAIELDPQYVKAMTQLAALYVWTLHGDDARPWIDRVLALVGDGPEYEHAMRLRATIGR